MPRSGYPERGHSKTGQMRDGVGHHPFAARLVQRAAAALDHDDVQSCLSTVDRGGQSGGAAAGDEKVDHVNLASAVFSTVSRVFNSAALSTVNNAAVIHALCTRGSAKPSTITAT